MYRLLVFLAVIAIAECHGSGGWHHFGGPGHNHSRHGRHHGADESIGNQTAENFGGPGNNHEHHFGGPGHHRWHHRNPCGRHHDADKSPENFPGSSFEDIAKNMILIDKALKRFCDENNINITSELYGQDNYMLKFQLLGFKTSDFEVKIKNRLIYTTANSKDDSNLKAFKDLRILPSTVDTSRASWVYEHKTLKVYIPYKTKPSNEELLYCGGVEETEKIVPQMVHGSWGLPAFICDVYIAMDVTSSTSSIFNLVAISVDRYIAVTQPIKYAKHKNNRRVWFTIVLVWMISAAIGAPIVLGLNDTPDRNYNECLFNSQNYVLYSSLGSFYIPCIMMMFLYYNIFKALRNRAKKQRAAKQPPVSEPATAAVVIENVASTRQLETAVDAPTNTGSGSNEDDHEDSFDKKSVELEDADDCHVIPNNRSTEFMLATVTEETAKTPKRSVKCQPPDPNGNNDSGYAASTLDRDPASPPASPGLRDATVLRNMGCDRKRNGKRMDSDSRNASIAFRSDDDLGTSQYDIRDGSSSKKERKASAATARFTIYKANKASKKKREKSSAKKERKATKTLAIVLGVFLFCWTPFFTCNVLDAICAKFGLQFTPGVTVFILNTWLGYINSFLNPVIYTIFNPEFRKAFRKILKCGT